MHKRLKFVPLLLLFYVVVTHASLIFHSPENLAGIELRSEQFLFVGSTKDVNISSVRLVASSPRDLCSHAKNEDLFQNNLVISTRDNCSPVIKFKNAQRGGAIGIIIMDNPEQYYDLAASYFGHADDVHIPGFSVIAESQDNFNDILDTATDNDNFVYVSLISDHPISLEAAMTPFSVIIGVWSLTNAILGSWKLYQFIKATQRLRFELPELCLLIEVAASLERLGLCPEPDTGLGRGLYEFSAINAFQTFSVTWSTIATMLMASYWIYALHHWIPETKQFRKTIWKIPFILLMAFLFVFDVVCSTLRALYFGGAWIRLTTSVICAIVVFIIAIIFIVSGIKILRFAAQAQGVSASKNATIRRLAFFVIGNAVALFLTIIGVLVIGIGNVNTAYLFGLFLVFIGISLVSTLQIMVFQPPDQTGSSSLNSMKLSKFGSEEGTIGVSGRESM